MSSKPPADVDQATFWNEDGGRRWVEHIDQLERMLDELSGVLVAAVDARSGERVLDVGCGCGQTSLELARRVGPSGAVEGVDISAPMLARARERARDAGLANARFHQADAQTARFGGDAEGALPAGFDLVFSRFGVMFFDEPVPAFAHLARALKKGGRVAFVCWRAYEDNAWAHVPREAVAPLAPPQAQEPRAPGPFRFAEGEWLESLLHEAGLTDVSLARFDVPMFLGASLDEAVDMTTQAGPAARQLAEVDEDTRARALSLVRDALSRHVAPDGHVALGTSSWVVTARR